MDLKLQREYQECLYCADTKKELYEIESMTDEELPLHINKVWSSGKCKALYISRLNGDLPNKNKGDSKVESLPTLRS
ncbi:MAG: hypothetical protein D4S01_09720 [Dehalococcoidia bacterium]|nr:MAG: hypothetical protein D4S01_09720 [Dehalococcoidia bacterium]